MIRNVLERIGNIEIWPVVSLIIFFVFFVLVLIRVFTTDKKHIDKMKEMPLEDNEKEEDSNGRAQK